MNNLSSSSAVPHAPLELPIERRNFAELHRDVWATFRASPFVFAIVPMLLWFPLDFFSTVAENDPSAFGLGLFAKVCGLFVNTFIYVMILGGIERLQYGYPVTVKSSLKDFWNRFGKIFIANFVFGILLFGSAMLFVIPVFFVATWGVLVVVVAAREDHSGWGAFVRSKTLVKEHGGPIFGYMVGASLLYLVVFCVAFGGVYGLLEVFEIDSMLLSTLVMTPINLLSVGFIISTALVYNDSIGAKKLIWPAGHSLIDGDQRAIPMPSSGRFGLRIAVAAAFTLVLLLVVFATMITN